MNVRVLTLLAAVAAFPAGCGPDPFVRPEPGHEVHKTLYDARPNTQPPPTAMGLPSELHPAPPVNSGPVGEIPGPNYIWVPGYFAYSGNAWHWVSGGWWLPERGKQWIPGRWVEVPGGPRVFYWQQGHWQ